MGASDVANFCQTFGANGKPTYAAPYSYPSNIALQGSQYFDLASRSSSRIRSWRNGISLLEQDLGKGVGLRVSYDGNHAYNIPTATNANQPPANTLGFNDPATKAAIPFPLLSYIATTNTSRLFQLQRGNHSMKKHAANLQFEVSYTFTRDLIERQRSAHCVRFRLCERARKHFIGSLPSRSRLRQCALCSSRARCGEFPV